MKAAYSAKKAKRKRGGRMAPPWVFALFVVFLAVFCFSAWKLTDGLRRAREAREAFQELSAIVAENIPAPEASPPPPVVSVPDSGAAGVSPAPTDTPAPVIERTPLPQYLPLYERNPDFFGWLSFEGADIDLPVMYSPDRPEYYLERSFDGVPSAAGVPFIDGGCPADGNYYLIYGHHMMNKSMFGQLPRYADPLYCEEHPTLRFDTLYEQREYRVAAVFYSRVYGRGETDVFRYYEYTDLSEKEIFDEYTEQVYAAAIYDTGVRVTYGDELLALSTCNYHTQNGRFVVVAKRMI